MNTLGVPQRRGISFSAAIFLSLGLLIAGSAMSAQTASPSTTISGQIQDPQGKPIPHATITVEETGTKQAADANGSFSLVQPPSGVVVHLRIEAHGCYPQTVAVDLKNAKTLAIVLTPILVVQQEVKVTAPRLDLPLSEAPVAASLIVPEVNRSPMPRGGVAAEEVLSGVSGMKIDNQANQERVHISIRGQGILTESGVRGIEVLLDGIPLNDPSGVAPDLYDIDWGGVQQVTVLKGPVAVMYGGGSTGGLLDIRTRDLSQASHGSFAADGGSNSFYKGRAEYAAKAGSVPFYVAAARAAGDGYRVHTAFYGDNLYGKFDLNPTRRLQLHTVLMGTGSFSQNPEGLNIEQVQQDPHQPNPDALTYNEFFKTQRFTFGETGSVALAENQHLDFTFYTRRWGYKESVPSSVDHQSITSPGGSALYHLEGKSGWLSHSFNVGLDWDHQHIGEYRHDNLGNAVEDNVLLSNQNIAQNRLAGYATEALGLGSKWTVLLALRGDNMSNRLTDLLKTDGVDLSGDATFRRMTARGGVSYRPAPSTTLYTSWGLGFLPPSTEELDSNPAAFGGFNKSLQPATSWGGDFGVRSNLGQRFFYDLAFFYLNTQKDFERYRCDAPNPPACNEARPLETFYRNGGDSHRYGFESEWRWIPTNRLTILGAYTYSHFTYTNYVSLTYPGDLTGRWLPNIPAHQIFVDTSYRFPGRVVAGVGTLALTRAYVDPTNTSWSPGYALINAHLGKEFRIRKTTANLYVAGRNLLAKNYIAFTEPDPDGNSYQPGPLREIFGGLQLSF